MIRFPLLLFVAVLTLAIPVHGELLMGSQAGDIAGAIPTQRQTQAAFVVRDQADGNDVYTTEGEQAITLGAVRTIWIIPITLPNDQLIGDFQSFELEGTLVVPIPNLGATLTVQILGCAAECRVLGEDEINVSTSSGIPIKASAELLRAREATASHARIELDEVQVGDPTSGMASPYFEGGLNLRLTPNAEIEETQIPDQLPSTSNDTSDPPTSPERAMPQAPSTWLFLLLLLAVRHHRTKRDAGK